MDYEVNDLIFLFNFLVFSVFCVTYGKIGTSIQYILLTGCVVLGALCLVLLPSFRYRLLIPSPLTSPVLKAVFFYLPALIFVSWLYGALLGVFNYNPLEDVLRNFAGLVVYLFFYILWLIRPPFSSIFFLLFLASLVQISYGVFNSFNLINNSINIVLLGSLSDLRMYYSGGLLLCFPLITAWLFARDDCHFKFLKIPYILHVLFKSRLFFIALCYTVLIPAMSKGFILAFTLLLFTYFSFLSFHCFRRARHLIMLMLLIVSAAIAAFLVPAEFVDLVVSSYSYQERSNLVRAEQYKHLVNDLTITGHGLGAPLSTGYSRSKTEYGFELTYLNLIHKLGLFSIPLLFCYIYTVTVALIRIFLRINMLQSSVAFGCLFYLIPGAGNPILLSPFLVVLHCIAIYILLEPYTELKHRTAWYLTRRT